MRYELWVDYTGKSSHIADQKIYDQPRFFTRRGALKEARDRQTFHDGLCSITRDEPTMRYYVKDRWKHEDLG